jgi:hypothetical protein
MSNYRQPSYEIPFSGAATPSSSSAMDDDFSNSRPQLTTIFIDDDDNEQEQPVPGCAELDEKWVIFDPAAEEYGQPFLTAAFVDTQQQVCVLETSGGDDVTGGKGWCGIYQLLPDWAIPKTEGEVTEIAIYARGWIQGLLDDGGNPEVFFAPRFGLFAGGDLEHWPASEWISSVGVVLNRFGASPQQLDVSAQSETAFFFDAQPTAIATALGTTPQYFRICIRQTCVSPLPPAGEGTYSADLKYAAGFTGQDWVPLWHKGYNASSADGPCFRAVGLGLNGHRWPFRVAFDFFRIVAEPFEDFGAAANSPIGSVQQLGSV